MEYSEFLRSVDEISGLNDPEKSAAAIKAVLETIGELLGGTDRRKFASQLPNPLRNIVYELAPGMTPRRNIVSRQQFVNRVQSRSGLNYRQSLRGTHAVFRTLQSAISAGEYDTLTAILKESFARAGEPIFP